MFLRYNELRMLIGDAAAVDARGTRRGAPGASARRRTRSSRATGSAPSRRRSSRSPTSSTGATRSGSTRRTGERRATTGSPASPGRRASSRAIARVVRTIDEFDEVTDGDILVCQMTNPAWVVLFTKIAGLVTDTGGTTSHPAVLAREFGIPAVIGTSDATHRIATGDRIRVDGVGGRGRDPARRRRGRRRPAAAIGS